MRSLAGRAAIPALAAALLGAAAPAAWAQTGTAPNYNCPLSEAKQTTCVNGGGSTSSANVYTGTSPSPGIFTTVASISGGTVGIYYEKASSGGAQQAFAGNDPY
jgi:hypothetical protein